MEPTTLRRSLPVRLGLGELHRQSITQMTLSIPAIVAYKAPISLGCASDFVIFGFSSGLGERKPLGDLGSATLKAF